MPLHFAAEENLKEISEILIAKGADLNAKNIIYQNVRVFPNIKTIKKK